MNITYKIQKFHLYNKKKENEKECDLIMRHTVMKQNRNVSYKYNKDYKCEYFNIEHIDHNVTGRLLTLLHNRKCMQKLTLFNVSLYVNI